MGVARIGREDQLMVSASLRELAHGGIDMGPPLHSLVRAPKACGIEGNRAGSRAVVRDREQSCAIEACAGLAWRPAAFRLSEWSMLQAARALYREHSSKAVFFSDGLRGVSPIERVSPISLIAAFGEESAGSAPGRF